MIKKAFGKLSNILLKRTIPCFPPLSGKLPNGEKFGMPLPMKRQLSRLYLKKVMSLCRLTETRPFV